MFSKYLAGAVISALCTLLIAVGAAEAQFARQMDSGKGRSAIRVAEPDCRDIDNDGYSVGVDCGVQDCDDENANVHPAATECCGNLVDDDCDGRIDEAECACCDFDGDGYYIGEGCDPADCNDTLRQVHPGATELCGNQIDDDCDGDVDEAECMCCDFDGDGYVYRAPVGPCGDVETRADDCTEGDCDDRDPAIHPGAPEICGNKIDDNCDGEEDEGCGCTDVDGDGYGTGPGCLGADCDDDDGTIHPGAPEVCGNDTDDNCDDAIDEACACADADGDGYRTADGCGGDDCDDADPDVHPGADELCGNDADDDCDGQIDELCACADADGDGYRTADGCGGNDCDDANPDVHPGADELCGNNTDDDCDGAIDEGFDYYLAPWRNELCQSIQLVHVAIGEPCIVGHGDCVRGGTVECSPDLLSVECKATPGTPETETEGEAGPEDPTCWDRVDNDCDGLIDHEEEPCQSKERCDGFDNDNDCIVDNPWKRINDQCRAVNDACLGDPCTIGIGACATSGILVCDADGTGTTCNAVPAQPGTEGPPGSASCQDGVDNDCDGAIDLADGDSCLEDERCDGIDNDNNGLIDDTFIDLGMPCSAGVGACAVAGVYICGADRLGTVCSASPATGGPEGPEGITCHDGVDNDCDGLIDAGDPSCSSGDLIATCALPYLRGRPGSDCTGWHLIQVGSTGGRDQVEVRAELLAMDADGTVLASLPVEDGEEAHLASRINTDAYKWATKNRGSRDGERRWHEVFAPIPMLRVIASDGASTSEAFCSTIPTLQVLRPKDSVVSQSENALTEVLAAIPGVDPTTLVIEVDGVRILDAISVDPQSDLPGGPFDGTVEINGQLVAVTDLIVRAGPIDEPSGNIVTMKLGDLGCGGHAVVIAGEKRRGAFPSTPSEECHNDDTRSSGVSMVFGVAVTNPQPGEVITDNGGIPSSVRVAGEICHGRSIETLKINGRTVDMGTPQITSAGGADASTITVRVPFDVTLPVASIHDLLLTGQEELGALDPGTNRLTVQATDGYDISTYESLYFAVGPVIPVPEPEEVLALATAAADEVVTAEVQRAFTMVLGTQGINDFFQEICNDIGPRIKGKVECRLNNLRLGPKHVGMPWWCCDPHNVTTSVSAFVSDSFECSVQSFPRTGPTDPGRVQVKIGLPDFYVNGHITGGCQTSIWILWWKVCLVRLTIDTQAAYNMQDVSLTFAITEDNILYGTQRADPVVNQGSLEKGPDGKVKALLLSNHTRIGCLVGDLLEVLRFLHKLFGGNDRDFDFRDKFKARLADKDLKESFTGLGGDMKDDGEDFTFNDDELADRALVIEHKLSEVKITGQSITFGTSAKFMTLDAGPEAEHVPGSQSTEAPLLNMPIPDPPDVVSTAPAGNILVAVSDDFFNQLLASLVRAGVLNTEFDIASRELGGFLPDRFSTCNTAFCVGIRGENCEEAFRFRPDAQERCRKVQARNLHLSTQILLHARVDAPPTLYLDDTTAAGGSARGQMPVRVAVADTGVPIVFRYPQISLSIIADRNGEPGFQTSLSAMPSCFGEGDVEAECSLWEACLDLMVRGVMERHTVMVGDPPRPKSRIRFKDFSLSHELAKGHVCGGESAEEANAGGDANDPDQEDLIDKIGQLAEDDEVLGCLRDRLQQETPELESSGLNFGGVVDFDADDYMNIIAIENNGQPFYDYIGITANLKHRDRHRRPVECCLDDFDGDQFGTHPRCVDKDCADTNRFISPGMPERCGDGLDNNCNLVVDEEPCCVDVDGDGYGTGRACLGPDCDDGNVNINPGVEEICNNHRDDNCNDRIDEQRCR